MIEMNITIVDKVPMVRNDQERLRLINAVQKRWSTLEQSGRRVAKAIKPSPNQGSGGSGGSGAPKSGSKEKRNGVCQDWVEHGKCSRADQKCGKNHPWAMKGKGKSAATSLPADAASKDALPPRDYQKAPVKMVSFECKDCSAKAEEDETHFTGPREHGCYNGEMTVRCSPCRDKRRAIRKAEREKSFAAKKESTVAVASAEETKDEAQESTVIVADAHDDSYGCSPIEEATKQAAMRACSFTSLLADTMVCSEVLNSTKVVQRPAYCSNATQSALPMTAAESQLQGEFETRHGIHVNETVPSAKFCVLAASGNDVVDQRSVLLGVQLFDEIKTKHTRLWSEVARSPPSSPKQPLAKVDVCLKSGTQVLVDDIRSHFKPKECASAMVHGNHSSCVSEKCHLCGSTDLVDDIEYVRCHICHDKWLDVIGHRCGGRESSSQSMFSDDQSCDFEDILRSGDCSSLSPADDKPSAKPKKKRKGKNKKSKVLVESDECCEYDTCAIPQFSLSPTIPYTSSPDVSPVKKQLQRDFQGRLAGR